MPRLIIPGTLPGMNEMILMARGNRYASNKQKQKYTDLVAWRARGAKLPQMQRIDVSIFWYEPDRRRDKDNIMAGTKFVFDGLVRAGVLKNDGWREIGDISHSFDVDRRNPRIEVEINDIGGAG